MRGAVKQPTGVREGYCAGILAALITCFQRWISAFSNCVASAGVLD